MSAGRVVREYGRVLVCLARNTVTVHTAREAELIAELFGQAAEHLTTHERNEAARLNMAPELAAGRATNAAFAVVNDTPPGRVASSVPVEDEPLDVA